MPFEKHPKAILGEPASIHGLSRWVETVSMAVEWLLAVVVVPPVSIAGGAKEDVKPPPRVEACSIENDVIE